MGTEGERLRPLLDEEWTDEVRALLTPTIASVDAIERQGDAAAKPPRTRPLNILLVLAHNPHLLRPFLPWATALAVGGALDRRHCELLALRASWSSGSAFEWGHHVDYAQAFGLSRVEIDRVPAGPDAEGWTPEQIALLRAADELHTSTTVSAETWRLLADAFDPAQLVEIVMTVGQYTMLSMVANSFGVEVEDGLEPLPPAPASSASTVKPTWRRGSGGPALDPRTVIHIDEAPLAERTPGNPPAAITLQPLTGADCDVTVLIFTFPPNYRGVVHWHPTDTVYVVRRGQFIVEGEGTYEPGDVRWVKSGTPYGPESAGPEGCEVMLIGAGRFPLPTYDPSVVPPPASHGNGDAT
jgi:alkylhydroperoxidase family enzyme